MANRFWVGGTATWDATAGTKWATTSGGAGGASVPTAADDVFLNAASGANTVTLSSSSVCRSLDCNGFTGTLIHPTSVTLNIGDATAGAGNIALRLVAGMTYSLGGTSGPVIAFVSTSATQQTITTGGKVIAGMTFNGAGGSWQLTDTLNVNANSSSSVIFLTKGTLDTNGQTVNFSVFSSNNSNTRALTLGASSLSSAAASNPAWDITTSTGMTLSAGTSTLTLSGNTGGFNGGGLTYNNVTLSATTNQQVINGANTFNNLTRTGGASASCAIVFGANQTITGTLTITGNSAAANRVLAASDTPGTQRTITAAAVSLTNADFMGIVGAGAASWSGTSLGDATGNSGITFTTPVTRYWVGNGGSWNSTTKWASSSGGSSGATVPLCHDSVVFDANSITSASQTITANNPRLGKDINFTGVLNTPALNVSVAPPNVDGAGHIFGNLTLISGMTISSSSIAMVFGGQNSQTFTTAGLTIDKPITINKFSGTLSLSGSLILSSTRALILTAGTFNANGQNVTAGFVNSTSTYTRTLTMGSGTWTINGTGFAWNILTPSNTLNANTSTLVMSDTSATSKTFVGGGFTYNTVTFSGDNITVNDSNTFGTLNINNAGLTNGLLLTAGTTTTISALATNGTAGSLAKLVSTSAGSAATISKSSGVVSVDYMSIQDSTATGGASWYAGTHSTNVSGNTGWVFTDPPVNNAAFLPWFM